jgi:hypothetical protein
MVERLHSYWGLIDSVQHPFLVFHRVVELRASITTENLSNVSVNH